MLVSENDRETWDRAQVLEALLAAHCCNENGVALLSEAARAGVSRFEAHDVQPSVSAFRNASRGSKTVLANDHVNLLDAKRVGAPQHRARIVRIGDAIQHEHQVVGSSLRDVSDPFEAPGGDHPGEGFGHELGGVLQLRRTFDLNHVWIVGTHLLRGLLRIDDDPNDERSTLIRLARDEERITRRGNHLEQG